MVHFAHLCLTKNICVERNAVVGGCGRPTPVLPGCHETQVSAVELSSVGREAESSSTGHADAVVSLGSLWRDQENVPTRKKLDMARATAGAVDT